MPCHDDLGKVSSINGQQYHDITYGGPHWQDAVVTPVLLSSAVLQIVGACVVSFSFSFGGIAGWALGLIDPNTVHSPYSLFSLGASISTAGDPALGAGAALGLWAIEITFYLFAFVTPLAQAIVLIVLWFAPLRVRQQTSLFIAAEVLHAWSGLEVFVVSIIVALLEIEQFVQFIVDPYCNPISGFSINKILREAWAGSQLQDELNHDDVCFDVIASLDVGCWLLFSASVLSLAGSSFVLRKCHAALESRRIHAPAGARGEGADPSCCAMMCCPGDSHGDGASRRTQSDYR
jgi:hypothetical protein